MPHNSPETCDPRLRTTCITDEGTVFESQAHWNRGKPSDAALTRRPPVDLHPWRTHYPVSAPNPSDVGGRGRASGHPPRPGDTTYDPGGAAPALWHRPTQGGNAGWHTATTRVQWLMASLLDRLWGVCSRLQRRAGVRPTPTPRPLRPENPDAE